MSAEAGYTVWIESKDRDADDRVLARGLTVAEVAELISKYGNANPYILSRDYSTFRAFELHQYDSDGKLVVVIGATVPKTGDVESDRRRAMAMIDIQTVERHHEIWPGRVSTDAEYVASKMGIEETFVGFVPPAGLLH